MPTENNFVVWGPPAVDDKVCPVPPVEIGDLRISSPPDCTHLFHPASQEFCACMDSYGAWFAEIGRAWQQIVFPTVSEVTDGVGVLGGVRKLVDLVLESIPFFGPKALNPANEVIDSIAAVVHNWWVGFKEFITKGQFCDVDKLIGITLFKVILGAFHSMDFGLSLGLTVKMQINVVLSPIETIANYLLNSICPKEIPNLADAMVAYLSNEITEQLLICWLSMRGIHYESWKPVVKAMRHKPQIDNLAKLRNREKIDEEDYGGALRAIGFTDSGERALIGNLRYEVPAPADLVRFAVRHCFEPRLIAKFGFNDERSLGGFKLDAYHHTAGLDYPIFTGPLNEVVQTVTGIDPGQLASEYTNVGLPEPTWAMCYWWANQQIPPQSWAGLARIRLAPDRDTTFEPQWMKTITFSEEDYNDLLRMNNYPKYYRDKMFALSYATIGQRFIRIMLARGKMTQEQVSSLLQRSAIMPAVADALAEAYVDDIIDKANPVRNLEHNKNIRVFRSISKAYKSRIVTRDTAFNEMLQLNLTDVAANVYLDMIDVDLRIDRVERAKKVIKKDYMDGAIDLVATRQLLARMLISAQGINELTYEWQFERGLTVKMATTEKLLAWRGAGIIDQPALLMRLSNLGWIAPDLLSYMAESQMRVEKRESALQAASLRTQRANAAVIQKLLKDARKQSDELLRELKRLLPVGRLIKWARQGSISEIYFENALAAQEYPPDIIAQYWQEVIKDGPLPKSRGQQQSSGPTVGTTTSSTRPFPAGPAKGSEKPIPQERKPGPAQSNP